MFYTLKKKKLIETHHHHHYHCYLENQCILLNEKHQIAHTWLNGHGSCNNSYCLFVTYCMIGSSQCFQCLSPICALYFRLHSPFRSHREHIVLGLLLHLSFAHGINLLRKYLYGLLLHRCIQIGECFTHATRIYVPCNNKSTQNH